MDELKLVYWVPAEELEEFNRNIEGHIDVLGAYFGPQFRGFMPDRGPLEGLDAASLLSALASADSRQVILENHEAVFLPYPFWEQQDSSGSSISEDERKQVLSEIRAAWPEAFAKIPLTMS